MDKPAQEIAHLFFHQWWAVSILVIVAATAFAHFIAGRFYKRVYPRLERTHLTWDASLVKALILPLKVLLWVLGFTFCIQVLALHFEHQNYIDFFRPIRDLMIVWTLLWLSLRFIKNMESEYSKGAKERKKEFDKTTVQAISQISRVAMIMIAILIFLQTRNVNLSAVFAFGGAGGLILGFAAKDLLANFFGGLMVYLDRPFSVGDWIKSPDREIEGYVENIGWRLTRIQTLEKRPIYVPNGVFSNISVINTSRMSHRRIRAKVGIRYDDASKMEGIVKEVEEMIRNHPEIDTTMLLMVRFDEFASSSLNFLIYCFTKTTQWADHMLHQQDIFLKTIKIIESHGAECAFPTTTLHIPDGVSIKQ